jgi:hypothetical protein
MKTGSMAIIITAASGIAVAAQAVDVPQASARRAEMTCLKIGQEVSGQNRICYYNCLGSKAATTIDVVQICPLTIRR